MSQAYSHIGKLITAQTPAALWQILCEAMLCYGFDRVSYGLSNAPPAEISHNDQDVVFFSNHAPPRGEDGTSLGHLMRTPLFRWVLENRGSCSWSWTERQLEAGLLSAEEVAAYRARVATGQNAGYTISFHDPSPRGRGVLILAASSDYSQAQIDQMWDERGSEIEAISYMMHYKMQLMPLPVRRRSLTPRQREALRWVAAGKTTQDIATIMSVTPAMVEKHLRRARETLDVETTAHAVAKATSLNHLFSENERAGA